MSDKDIVQRFLFDDFDIRGELISLNQSLQDCLARQELPDIIKRQIGEFMAAAGLLSSTLKFDGVISLQATGTGPLTMIMADCTRHRNLRAIARLDERVNIPEHGNLSDLTGNSTLAITLTPARGERYQGLVSLESGTLAQSLETYFKQSEQLETRLWIACDDNSAAALLLQKLPTSYATDIENAEAWERITLLGETISDAELLDLNHADVLHRLFHQESLRLFEAQPVQFACSCSRTRIAEALITLGEKEITSIIREQGSISVNCEFCGERYQFHKNEARKLFDEQPPTLH